MLDQAEITSIVERTLREIHKHYPTPYPALEVAWNLHEYRNKTKYADWTLLVRNMLPEGWADWFLHLWMAKTMEIYGAAICQEEVQHLKELLEHDLKSGLTGWRCPITETQLALCEKFWFPRQATGGER